MFKRYSVFFLLLFSFTIFYSCSPQGSSDTDIVSQDTDDFIDDNIDADIEDDAEDFSDIKDANDVTDSDSIDATDIEEYDPVLKTTFINVGQGDSSLIENKTGDFILIDTGRTIATAMKIQGIIASKQGWFNLLIATHFDADHMGASDRIACGSDMQPGVAGVDDDGNGTTDVRIEPGEYGFAGSDDIMPALVWDRGDYNLSSTTEVDEFQAAFEGLREIPSPGDKINLDSEGTTLEILSVNGQIIGEELTANDENARSIAVLISRGNFDMLITGDLPSYIEEAVASELAGRGILLDVLHLGHHGSDSSTSAVTLALLQPLVAVVSVGNSVSCGHGFNLYGHPSQEVLDRLDAAGVNYVFQTNEGGAKPTTGSCQPAAGETYPRDYHSIELHVANADIFLTTDGTDFNISFGNEKYTFTAR